MYQGDPLRFHAKYILICLGELQGLHSPNLDIRFGADYRTTYLVYQRDPLRFHAKYEYILICLGELQG